MTAAPKTWRAAAFGLAAGATALAFVAPSFAATRSDAAAPKAALAQVRAATAQYHNVDKALADGYVDTGECVQSPAGTMAVHYINPALAQAPVDENKPALLLYLPDAKGKLRLVGVEYFKADADQNLATTEDRPTLFGRPFDGPMPGHQPGMPVHYDLHVWLWAHNPAGTFALFNPRLSCPA